MVILSVALVVCVGIICFTTLKIIQSRPKKHVHSWWTEGYKVINNYTRYMDGNLSEMPTSRTTHFSMSCESCGEKKIEVVDGVWTGLDSRP